MFNLNMPLRTAQAILAVITIGMNAYVSHWYFQHTLNHIAPNSTMYLLVLGSLTVLLLPYLFLNPALAGRKPTRFFNKHAILAIDAVLTLAWAGGFIALAVFQHRLILCGGHVCQIMAGGAAVGAIQCASFLATTGLAAVHVMRTRKGEIEGQMQMNTHSGWVGSGTKA